MLLLSGRVVVQVVAVLVLDREILVREEDVRHGEMLANRQPRLDMPRRYIAHLPAEPASRALASCLTLKPRVTANIS